MELTSRSKGWAFVHLLDIEFALHTGLIYFLLHFFLFSLLVYSNLLVIIIKIRKNFDWIKSAFLVLQSCRLYVKYLWGTSWEAGLDSLTKYLMLFQSCLFFVSFYACTKGISVAVSNALQTMYNLITSHLAYIVSIFPTKPFLGLIHMSRDPQSYVRYFVQRDADR
jgi:hypothetical protein